MKPLFAVLVLAFGLLLAGCAQNNPPSSAPSSPAPSAPACTPSWSCGDWSSCTSDGQQTRACTDKNACGVPAGKPSESRSCAYVAPFQPVHLVYAFSMPSGPQFSSVQFDYYLDEQTACGGKPAINGLVKLSDPASPSAEARYAKITIYPDTGEAVYSNDMDARDIGFDTAQSSISSLAGSLDPAFYIPSLMAKGGKSMLSAEVWNSTRPVILKGVGAFGGAGDYSLVQTGTKTSAGVDCTDFTLNAKASNFGGQMQACVHFIPDVNLAVMTGGAYPGGGPSWSLSAIKREKSPDAYYSQCLAPIVCPSLSAPTSDDYGSCNALNKTYNTEYNADNCVTAFNCVTFIERARSELARMQRGGSCAVDEGIAQKAADCWARQGNVNFQNGPQSNCIVDVECQMMQPGPG
ncbi:MAG: hypothetical protein M1530_03675 [Candidatus Marsarchaeota archaeon]|nr:hypothetical protein [Candidatus Marsarchaeota archaeon]